VVLQQPLLRREQVAGRPALVAVVLPEVELVIEADGVLDAEPLDAGAQDAVLEGGRVARRVDRDDPQAVAGVALVPRLQVGQRPQRVHAADVEELDEHRPAPLLVHPQRRDVDPAHRARERRCVDGVHGGSHERRR
jgi:hypothetical protein